jgi:hypothetical protein
MNSVEVATSLWWRDADGVLARVRGDAAVVREIISLKVGRKPAAAATGSRGYAGSATARPNQVAAPVLASMKDDDDHELQAVVRRGALQEQIKLNRIAVEESVDLLRQLRVQPHGPFEVRRHSYASRLPRRWRVMPARSRDVCRNGVGHSHVSAI